MDYTKRAKVVKNLKFELRPVGRTGDTIRKRGFLEADEALHEKHKTVYPLFDAYVKSVTADAFLKEGGKITAELIAKEKDLENNEKKAMEEMQTVVRKAFDRAAPAPIGSINSGTFLKKTLPEFLDRDKGFFVPLDQYSVEEWKDILAETTITYLSKYAVNRITSFDNAAKRAVENFMRYRENTGKLQSFLVYAKSDEGLREEACVKALESAVYLDYYEMCLTASDIDRYNQDVKGVVGEKGIVKKGINMLINEVNQQHKADRGYNGPMFKLLDPLYQQILMPREKQYDRRKLENDEELNAVVDVLKEKVGKNEMEKVVSFLKETEAENLVVYGKDLHQISHLVFGDHSTIPDKMQAVYVENQYQQLEAGNKKAEKNIEKAGKTVREKFYSFAEITEFLKSADLYEDVKAKFVSAMVACMMSADMCKENLPTELRFKDKSSKQALIAYFEPMNEFNRLVKLLKKKSDRQEDGVLNELEKLTKDFDLIPYTHNLVHGYMTRTPKDMAKEMQICFGLSTKQKLEWWNGDKVPATKDALLLKKDGKFYFATKTPKGRFVNNDAFAETQEGECYSVFLQKKARPAFTNFPKITFYEPQKEQFFEKNPEADCYILEKGMRNPVVISRELYEIKKNGLFKKNAGVTEEERLSAMWKLIDFYKEVAENYIQFERFHFKWSDTKDYQTIDEFFDEVNLCSISMEWRNVSAKKIDEEVENGSLLMFLIWQRDLYKRGLESRNSYVKTFLSVFEPENMANNEIRLNSNTRLSFRPAAMERKVTHPAGSIVVNRRTADGTRIPESVHNEIYRCYQGKISYDQMSAEAKEWCQKAQAHKTEHDLVKNRRYTEDKFFISITYTKNADVIEKFNPVSTEVREEMKDGFYTMSIARGIQDLLYYEVFDEKKQMVEHGSLNILFGTNYAEYLQMLSDERKNGKSEKWEYDKKVKNIKDVYLNDAIAKILQIAFKYNAKIVIEKMNPQFKQKWACIDNQLFSVFEKRLETKLLDYHNADIPLGMPGSVTNPLQAAYEPKGEPVQNGILFRLNGAYTSNIDPYTGFVNLFPIGNYNGTKSRRDFFAKFRHINYRDGYVYFHFDYRNFGNIKYETEKTEWTVKAGGRRTKYDRSFKFNYMDENIAKNVEDAMEKAGVKGDLKEAIDDCPAYLVNALFELFKFTVTNTVMKKCKENEEEYCISPILGDIPEKDRIKPIHARAEVLAEKMWFYLDYNEKEFTKDWINYIQKRKAA